jgi:FtsZ-binding cell division protein ZapB
VKLVIALLALSVSSAVADDVRVTLPLDAVRALVKQNEALRADNKQLDEESDKWRQKYQTLAGMVGSCT